MTLQRIYDSLSRSLVADKSEATDQAMTELKRYAETRGDFWRLFQIVEQLGNTDIPHADDPASMRLLNDALELITRIAFTTADLHIAAKKIIPVLKDGVYLVRPGLTDAETGLPENQYLDVITGTIDRKTVDDFDDALRAMMG